MTDELSASQLAEWLLRFCVEVRRLEAHLNDLDAATGDGEHGSNLCQGAVAVESTLTPGDFGDVRALLEAVGMALVNSVGGASGALYGTFFLRLSDVGAGRTGLDLAALTEGLTSSLVGIRELGSSAPGDKTLVDALHPAVASLPGPAASGVSLTAALDRAATAAESGRDATADMVARIGRGSYLGDRSRGHVDAGATSMALLLRCLSTTAQPRHAAHLTPGPSAQPDGPSQ